MSSRATKKRIWRLKNMSKGDWLNMLRKMSTLEYMEFGKWCYIYGLSGRYVHAVESARRGRYTHGRG